MQSQARTHAFGQEQSALPARSRMLPPALEGVPNVLADHVLGRPSLPCGGAARPSALRGRRVDARLPRDRENRDGADQDDMTFVQQAVGERRRHPEGVSAVLKASIGQDA